MRNKNLISGHHCVYRLTYHVIFVTKFRRKCLTIPILQDLCSFLKEYTKKLGLSIEEINGNLDHIHFLLNTKPTDKLSNVIGCLKSSSSKFLHNKGYNFPYWGKLSKTIWSKGYFVCSTGGATLDILEKYIRNQNSC